MHIRLSRPADERIEAPACLLIGTHVVEAEAKGALLVGLNSATGLRGLKYNELSGNHAAGRILKVDTSKAAKPTKECQMVISAKDCRAGAAVAATSRLGQATAVLAACFRLRRPRMNPVSALPRVFG